MEDSYIYYKVKEYIQLTMPPIIMRSIDEKWKPVIVDTITELQDELVNHCVLLILYIWYREFSEKHSIYYYLNDSNAWNNEPLSITAQKMLDGYKKMERLHGDYITRDLKEYDNAIYAYRNFRTEKDEFAKSFLSYVVPDFQGLYKNLGVNKKGEKINTLSGQELSFLSFLELLLIKNNTIIPLLQCDKFSKSKNLPHYKFENEYFAQIKDKDSGIYNDIQRSKLCQNAGVLIRTLNLFALEVNCHFERNYLIAKALSTLKISKKEKDKEKDIFTHINYFQDGEHRYQDYIVLGYEKILARYDYKNVDATDIYNIVHLSNCIINNLVNDFFDNLTYEDVEEKNLYIEEVKILEEFIDGFIGRGQHINEKDLKQIKIKDFRDLYASISY